MSASNAADAYPAPGVYQLASLVEDGNEYRPVPVDEKALTDALIDKADEERPMGESAGTITIKIDSTCAICQKSMRNPRLLDCLHAFCSGCIRAHHRSQGARSAENGYPAERNCPTCRTEVRVQNRHGGFSSSVLNRRARDLHKKEQEEAKRRKRNADEISTEYSDRIEGAAKRLRAAIESLTEDAIGDRWTDMLEARRRAIDEGGEMPEIPSEDDIYKSLVRKVKGIRVNVDYAPKLPDSPVVHPASPAYTFD